MSVRDNRDGTITITNDDTGEEKTFQKGTGEEIGGSDGNGKQDLGNPADGNGGGGGRDQQQGPLTQGQIIVGFRKWLNGDRSASSLSPNAAKRALEAIGADSDLIDSELRNFNATQEQEELGGTGDGDGGGGGGGRTGDDEQRDFDPFQDQELEFGEFEAQFPAIRELGQSAFGAGRQNLFGQFAERSLPSFRPGFVDTAINRSFAPLNAQFLLNTALGNLSTKSVDLGEGFQPATGVSFSDFLGSNPLSGGQGIESLLRQILPGLQDPNAGGRVGSFRNQLLENPGFAQQFITPSLGIPTFGPFASGARDIADRSFNRFQAQNPGFSGVDIFSQFLGGGIQGLGSFF